MRGAVRALAAVLVAAHVCAINSGGDEQMPLSPAAAEAAAEASDAQIPCENGMVMDGACHCEPGWAGHDCTMKVSLPPEKQRYEGAQPTADYDYTPDDRWTCPGGCSAHGECNRDTRICECESNWSGLACEKLTFMAGRSDPALDDADEDETMAVILQAGTEAPEKAVRMLSFLGTMRSSILRAERRVAAEETDLEAKQELKQINETLWSVGGVRRLVEDREDVRRAQLEDLREKYDELSIRAVERIRTQVTEDTVADVVRRTVVPTLGETGEHARLGKFKMFKPTVEVPDLEDPADAAASIVRSVDTGKPFDHEVIRKGATATKLEKRGTFNVVPISQPR